jgi:hypothetical protein
MEEGREYSVIYRGQDFLRLNDLTPRPPSPSLSCQQVVSLSEYSCVSPVEIIDGEEGGGRGGGGA